VNLSSGGSATTSKTPVREKHIQNINFFGEKIRRALVGRSMSALAYTELRE
jgi:hypothetical protein